jgi:hypothetical protein
VPPTATPVPTYVVSGVVYVDNNNNGVQDAGDTVYSGATVQLTGSTTVTVTTNKQGVYTFSGVALGQYTVLADVSNNYLYTTTNPVTINVTADTTANFGVILKKKVKVSGTTTVTGSVQGASTHVLGASNQPLSGVQVSLSDGIQIATQSSQTGTFDFGSIDEGLYTLTVTAPEGYSYVGTNPQTLTLAADTTLDLQFQATAPTPTSQQSTNNGGGGSNTGGGSNNTGSTGRKKGDVNGDGKIDVIDLSRLLARWNTSDSSADLNGSGRVDILDLSVLLSQWGK